MATQWCWNGMIAWLPTIFGYRPLNRGDEGNAVLLPMQNIQADKSIHRDGKKKRIPYVKVGGLVILVVVVVVVAFYHGSRKKRVSSDQLSTTSPGAVNSTDDEVTSTAPTSATTVMISATTAVPTSATSTPEPASALVPGCQDVCHTTECEDAAAHLLSNMNPGIDPCADFYEFACGHWNRTEKIPDGLFAWGVFEKLKQEAERSISDTMGSQYPAGSQENATSKAQHFYQICIRSVLPSAANARDDDDDDHYSSSKVPDQKECLRLTIKYFPEPVDRLYVERNFPKGTKQKVEVMIRYVREAFISTINSSNWMTPPTKAVAIAKARNLQSAVGYSDRLYDDQWLNSKYQNVKLTDSYSRNRRRMETWMAETARETVAWSLARNGTVAPPDDTYPTIVNAFFFPTKNSISFPAAILQRPVFANDYQYYWNFGAMTAIVGHEVTHGFANANLPYDGTNYLTNAWDAESRRNFEELAKRLENQYSNYRIMGLSLNGTKSREEDIADNGGLKVAFYAYRQFVQSERHGVAEACLPGMKYSPEQLFFLANAQMYCKDYTADGLALLIDLDTHTLDRFRVIGPMQNFDEFAAVFQCPVGSYMNPEQKNIVW